MNYRILKSKSGFESDITKSVKVALMFLFCLLFIFIGVMAWVLFSPQIKNAISGNKLAGCNIVLPGLPGVYCQGLEHGNIFYYNAKIKVFIK